ncbi:MAG: ATP-binding cassette domain-containing protein, partial [Candidatus Dormibacteraceae bacterium]
VLFGSFAGLTSLVTPLFTGIVFNEIVPNDQRGRLLAVVAVLACLAISVALASLARGIAFARLQARFEGNAAISLWDRLLHLPVGFFAGHLVGDLTNRAISLELVQNVMTDTSVAIVLNGVFSLFNLLLFASAGPWLLLAGLALVAIEVGIALVLILVKTRFSREQLLAQNSTQAFLLQMLRGIYKLRVAAAESQALTIWARLFAAQQRAAYRAGRAVAASGVFATVWTTLTTLVIVATVAWAGLGGTSIGSYMEFTTAFGQVSLGLAGAFDALSAMVLLAPLLDQLRPLLETPVEAGRGRQSPGALVGGVTVSRVRFRYRPDSPLVLDDVSLAADPGEFIAIVGPSGAGKSSLVRLLLGFETPEAGSVLYDHKDLSGLDPVEVRRQVGTLIQSAKLLPGSIFSNIAAGHPLTREEAWEAAAAAGVADEIRGMPMGLETVVVEGAPTVSGGQRQRILIARALARKPRILIFDEATSALDNVTQATVTASLARLNVTRIVIAHRLSTIRDADRICVLVGGRVEQVGTFEELAAVPGPFSELAARQIA